ncbi:MAG TPA: hypothetical protein VHM25_24935 [Polyangiaceae bacterium]|nr:hypothetical protein [Polyangiaceae bacterium]
MTTDPGLGPVEREHASTLRSMTAAEPIPEDEIPGAPVYFEPKPLHAVSDHKTLELETVKLAKDIDPRKLPTELKLRRPVLHVLPASDPNWPAPAPLPDAGNPSPLFDSNWPPPETVLTTSTPPLAKRRRSFVPLLLLLVLSACFVLVVGARRLRHRAGAPAAVAVRPVALAAAAAPSSVEPVLGAAPSSENSAVTTANAAPPPVDSAESPEASESPPTPATAAASPTASASAATETVASALPPRVVEAPHHAPIKPTSLSSTSSSALSAPTAKPKRAIY